jgi:diguanylate cyclase (GGDEF)-like protein/PAS domain S-box-containing protein
MDRRPVDNEVLDEVFDSILRDHPDVLLAALGDDGFRVPMPPAEALCGLASVPVPPQRATMADLVVPGHRLTVVSVWERARRDGVAGAPVLLRGAPPRSARLKILDMRHRFGIWLAALAPSVEDRPLGTAPLERLPAPLRPRSATMRLDMFANIMAVDERTVRMLGWPADQMIGARGLEIVHPDDHERVVSDWLQMLSDKQGKRHRLRYRCRDGTLLWVESESSYLDADDPDDVEVVVQLHDISEEMAAHEATRHRERLFRRLAESLPVGILQLGQDGCVTYVNERFAQILGFPAGSVVGTRPEIGTEEDRRAVSAAVEAALDATGDQELGDQELEVSVRRADNGEVRRCAVTVVHLTPEEGEPGAVICLSDITESARLREQLQKRATFDPLTRCYNREPAVAVLARALSCSRAGTTGVMFVDLDGFKEVNDVLGHLVGDELLVRVAQRLAGSVRAGDVVGRFGGDEFLVVCREVRDPDLLLKVAERAFKSLSEPICLAGAVVNVRASIGVCSCSGGGATPVTMIEHADAAMYESKRRRADGPVACTSLREDSVGSSRPSPPLGEVEALSLGSTGPTEEPRRPDLPRAE